jgi:WD40 repeat protein
VRILDADTGREVRAFDGHFSSVRAVAYSPDGRHIASLAGDKEDSPSEVRVWDVDSGLALISFQVPSISFSWAGPSRCLTFSPDGRRIAVAGGDETVRVWDATSGREVLKLRGHEANVTWVAFSSDGRHLASTSWDGTLKVWDAVRGQEPLRLPGPERGVTCLAFSADGKALATGDSEGVAWVWDVATGQQKKCLRYGGPILSVAFVAGGRLFTAGPLSRPSPRGRGTTTVWGATVWDIDSGREICVLPDEGLPLACSPDGRFIAGTTHGSQVRVWATSSGETVADLEVTPPLGTYEGNPIFSFSADGATLAAVSGEWVHVWEISTSRKLLTTRADGNHHGAWAISPGGKRVVRTSGVHTKAKDRLFWQWTDFTVWEIGTGKQGMNFRGHTWLSPGVCFSPDDRRLASAGGADGTVKLWNPGTGQELLTLKAKGGVGCVAFSPDGNRLAAGCLREVVVWDARPAEELQTESEK